MKIFYIARWDKKLRPGHGTTRDKKTPTSVFITVKNFSFFFFSNTNTTTQKKWQKEYQTMNCIILQ